MSNIVVKIAHPVAANNAIAAVRAITSQSMAEVKQALSQGHILKTYTLFTNDHDECAGKLLQLLSALKTANVPFQLFELDPDETYTEATLLPQDEISEEVLGNILDTHAQGIIRQHRLGAQGL